MDKGFNLKVSEYKENLIQGINTCGLPISVVAMVFRDITRKLDEAEVEAIQKEMREYSMAIDDNAGTLNE